MTQRWETRFVDSKAWVNMKHAQNCGNKVVSLCGLILSLYDMTGPVYRGYVKKRMLVEQFSELSSWGGCQMLQKSWCSTNPHLKYKYYLIERHFTCTVRGNRILHVDFAPYEASLNCMVVFGRSQREGARIRSDSYKAFLSWSKS